MSDSSATIDLNLLGGMFANRVARASDLIGLGLCARSIYRRCAPGGPWQRLLPGVLLLANAPPTRAQMVRAALCYAEEDAVLTGSHALLLHGMRSVPAPGSVHVLVPHRRQLRGTPQVYVERTTNVPKPMLRQGFLVAPLERALVDALRHSSHAEPVRATIAEAVWRKGVPVAAIQAELATGNQRGTALTRRVLEEVAEGIRTSAEGLAGQLIRVAQIPQPQWNVNLENDEVFLGPVSGWWAEVGMALDIDQEADTPRRAPARAFARHAALLAAGVILVQVSTGQLKHAPREVIAELAYAHHLAGQRDRPAITANAQQPRRCGAR
ncbi:hypothetical protein [Kutzneria albida]|uniref:Transcriptional regulator, AbiEi antitoxin, Type IV TA system n=1 Tax=Kutzneria albida DSM 43870 TaxID=1449976 RepID=W5WA53_9PSEU|nr:hypothetical protein [Kutzneria albida]AHH95089.1 hypothetical protein KALB_1718 [Kutzneria albida DSM 43870]